MDAFPPLDGPSFRRLLHALNEDNGRAYTVPSIFFGDVMSFSGIYKGPDSWITKLGILSLM